MIRIDWTVFVTRLDITYNNSSYYRRMIHIIDAIIQHKSTKMVSHRVAHYRIGVCTRPTLRAAITSTLTRKNFGWLRLEELVNLTRQIWLGRITVVH